MIPKNQQLSQPTCIEHNIDARIIDPDCCVECPRFDRCRYHKRPAWGFIPGFVIAAMLFIILYAIKIAFL